MSNRTTREFTILLLDDRGPVVYGMTRLLEREYAVEVALDLYDANSILAARPVDAIIADLNMSCNGLPAHLWAKTQGGCLTGWIWLTECVFPRYPELEASTIVYSDYIDQLRKVMASEDMGRVTLVSKRSARSPVQRILDVLRDFHAQREEARDG